MIRVNAIDHINMSVNNLEKSILFYEKLFGWAVCESDKAEH